MKKLSITFFLLLLIPALVFAQDAEPLAILEYFDNPDGVLVFSGDGEEFFPEYGMELLPGDQIKTTDAVAELRLDPNGTLIKLAPNTEFIIDTLQNRGGAEANTFSLITGKLRAVAARDGAAQYQIRTQTAVCGVRGTTFGLESAEGATDAALVEKGQIAFQKLATGETIDLVAGQFADTFSDAFEAVAATADQIADFFEGIQDFVGENMNENAVPGNEPEEVAAVAEPEEEAAPTEAPPVITEPPAEEAPAEDGEAEAPAEPSFMDPIMEWLREVLGMEIGSITIDNKTYSKAVLQPQFTLGKLRLGLYLPIIYETNMFEPADWYHPKGNDEWSFGTDQDWRNELLISIQDVLGDLFLKIKYVEFGDQRDKFFFKVGNLTGLTIGHGTLMRNYANDANFPAVRRIGVNLGFDLGVFGMETLVNDLSEPELFGLRLYLKPFHKTFPMAIGISSVMDIDPAGDIPVDSAATDDPDLAGNPIFINAAFDLDFPIVNADFFKLTLFGDIAGMMPYYRDSITDGTTTIEPGLYSQALINTEAAEGELPLNNYGIAAGIFGNIFIADYRLEYRNYRGTFKPAFYGKNYDRVRGEYAVELKSDLLNSPEIEPVMGIYGEAGFNILDKFRFEAGYMWPWAEKEDGTFNFEDDLIHLEAELAGGLIPVVDIHGSISYDRTKFVPGLLGEDNLTLFDANTVMKGEVIYSIAPTLDIAILITTSIGHDEDGNIVLDTDSGMPQINPTFSIETRIHF